MNILTTLNLCKIYGKDDTKVVALNNASISVSKGEFVSVIGPSGSGKSTLLNMIGALDQPTSGTVTIDGRAIDKMKEAELSVFRRRNIGFIFQSFNLIPELNVEENIMLPILLDYQKPDKHYIDELLGILGLGSEKTAFTQPAFGWSATAGGHRPGIGHQAGDYSCRRANR